VLHTRISEALADELRRAAEELRVPVSNLVRNALEETFHAVETVSENVGELVEDVVEEAEQVRRRLRRRRARRSRAPGPRPDAPRAPHPDVIGWQPLVFNQPRRCADCEVPIEVGERGFVGLTARGPSELALCDDCVEARR
jgi:hypothetical protein